MSLVIKTFSYPVTAQVLSEGGKFVASCTRCRNSGRPTSDVSVAEKSAVEHGVRSSQGKCPSF